MSRLEPDDVLVLPKGHGWRVRPGCSAFVADRGKLRLDYPAGWVWSKDDDSFKFRDREPPADRCTLAVSLWEVVAEAAREAPLGRLVEGLLAGDGRRPIATSAVREERRGGLELAWGELTFLDANERRPAVARWCLAREGRLQVVLSLDFWPEDAPWVDPAWEGVLATLELNRPIADPQRGPMEH